MRPTPASWRSAISRSEPIGARARATRADSPRSAAPAPVDMRLARPHLFPGDDRSNVG